MESKSATNSKKGKPFSKEIVVNKYKQRKRPAAFKSIPSVEDIRIDDSKNPFPKSEVEKLIEEHMKNPTQEGLVLKEGDIGQFNYDVETNKETELNEQANNYSGIQLPDSASLSTSPEIVFGQATVNMVAHFMEQEKEIEKNKRKGVFRRFFRRLFCCR